MCLISTESVTSLLEKHAAEIETLKQETLIIMGEEQMVLEPYNQDVFYLRFCLREKGADQLDLLRKNLAWRLNEGKVICQAAREAVELASTDCQSEQGHSLSYDIVLSKCPLYDRIAPFIPNDATFLTKTSKGDLLHVIRGSRMNAKDMMKVLSVEEASDFLIYLKEVNMLWLHRESVQQDRLAALILVNDVGGVTKMSDTPPSFRQALSQSSHLATTLYPRMAGPTVLLNLPAVLNALVKIMMPILPSKLRQRMRFARGVMDSTTTCQDIQQAGPRRDIFLRDIDRIVYTV
jgi:hypothetical protein